MKLLIQCRNDTKAPTWDDAVLIRDLQMVDAETILVKLDMDRVRA